MTQRKATGVAILSVMAAALLAVLVVVSDPWWLGPVAIGGGVAVAAVIAYAISLIMDP